MGRKWSAGKSAPLFGISPDRADRFDVGDAVQGIFITGAIGSGKNSGSGATVAQAMLNLGFGGLVLTATPEEKPLWLQRCRETGREDSVIVFGPGETARFDPLRYETARPGAGAGLTENVVRLFDRLAEVGQHGQSHADEGFWRQGREQLLRAAVDLLFTVRGRVTLPELYELIGSAPGSTAELHSPAWQARSPCYRLVAEGEKMKLTPRQASDFGMSAAYFFNHYPNMAEKTRSIFVASFTGIADPLLRGVMRELFCSGINLVPEMSHQGAIILLDLPVVEYGYVGQLAQVLFKESWQRATARRAVDATTRPVFLWMDEAQYFVSSADTAHQNIARHCRCATVALTQNLPNLFSAFPGPKGEEDARRFIGCLNTKIFHGNGCQVTNEYAAETIGRDWVEIESWNANSAQEGRTSSGVGGNMTFEYQVPPRAFTELKTGGPGHDFVVEGFIFETGGRRWSSTGKPWTKVCFRQS